MALTSAGGVLLIFFLFCQSLAEVAARKPRHPKSKYCEWKCKLSNHFGGTGIFNSLEDLWDGRTGGDECHCKNGAARGSARPTHRRAHKHKAGDDYWQRAAKDRSKRIDSCMKKERAARAEFDECRARENLQAQELHDLQLQNHERASLISELEEKIELATASEAAEQHKAKVWLKKFQDLEAALELERANVAAAEGNCNIDDTDSTLADELQEQLRQAEQELQEERQRAESLDRRVMDLESFFSREGSGDALLKAFCAILVVAVILLAFRVCSLQNNSQTQKEDLRKLRSEQKAEHEDFVKQEEFDRKLTSALDFGIYNEGKNRRAKVFCPGVEPNEITINIIFNGCEVVVMRRAAPGVNAFSWNRTFRFHPIKDGLFEFKADQATLEHGILDLVFHHHDCPVVVWRFPPQHNMAVCDYDQNWDVPSDHAGDGESCADPALQAAGRDCRAKPMPPGGPPPSVLRTTSGRLEGVADDMAGSVNRRAETSASPLNSESIEEVIAQVANVTGGKLPIGRAQSVIEDFNSNASVSITPLGNEAKSSTDAPRVPHHMLTERCASPDSDQSFVVVSDKQETAK